MSNNYPNKHSNKTFGGHSLKKSKAVDRKKNLLITIAVISVILIVMSIVALLISKLENNAPEEQQNKYQFDYADYNEDITEDKVYMGYDRNIYYTNPDGYMTVSVERDNMEDVSEVYREPVLFLMDCIDAMIAGDVSKYNSFFGAEYYKNTDSTPKESFTPQKLYSITITAVTYWYDDSSDSGVRYYNFGLDYMIKNNNGTLRSDMGSDAIRRIYLTIKEENDTFSIIDRSYISSLQY